MTNSVEDTPTSDPIEIRPSPAELKPLRGYWVTSVLICLLGVGALWLDRFFADPNNMEAMPGDLKRFVSLSEIFAHGFGIGVVAIGIWLLARPSRRLIPRIVSCAVWPSLGVHLIKLFFARARPIVYFDENSLASFPGSISETFLGWLPRQTLNTIYHFQSFPSGHAATVWGLAIGMAWAFPKGRWLYFTLAFLASSQRVSSFAHWTSDVLFGTAIAFLMAGALTQNWGLGFYFGKFENRDSDLLG